MLTLKYSLKYITELAPCNIYRGRMDFDDIMTFLIMALVVIFYIAFYGAIFFIAYHFIVKFW